MEMRRKMAAGSYKINNFVAQQIGLAAGDTDPEIALNTVQRAEQVDEVLVGGSPEITDIHTAQNNLLCSAGDSFSGFPYQRFDRRVTALAARQRNGAIGAEIVAAVLYLEEAPRAVVLAVCPVEIVYLADWGEVDC